MDRLTDITGQLFTCGNSICEFEPRQICVDCKYQHEANNRLAEYENTQLKPNEIKSLAKENTKLRFMIENGLGWEDMVNDIPNAYQPH